MNNDIVPGFDTEKSESLSMRLQKIEGLEGVLVVHASGSIDTYNTPFFERSIRKAIEAGFVRIVFELSRVDYISSHPIGVLTQLLRTVKSADGDLVLNNVRPKVSEVLRLLGLSQFFTFTEQLRESVAHFTPDRFRCVGSRTILEIAERTDIMTGREKEALHGT